MVTYIQQTGDALLTPLASLWTQFIKIIPGLIAGILVLIAGYIIASAFGLLFSKFLQAARVDQQLKRAGLSHSIGFLNISNLGGGLLKWYIVAVFTVQAAAVMNLGVLSDQLGDLAKWLPQLFIGVIVLLIGFILSDLVADKMLHAKKKGMRVFSSIVRWFIIVFIGLVALQQMGINVSLATNVILLLVGGIVVGLALALGIGFGFALKDEAKAVLKALKKNW
jgi:hypothetical protein